MLRGLHGGQPPEENEMLITIKGKIAELRELRKGKSLEYQHAAEEAKIALRTLLFWRNERKILIRECDRLWRENRELKQKLHQELFGDA